MDARNERVRAVLALSLAETRTYLLADLDALDQRIRSGINHRRPTLAEFPHASMALLGNADVVRQVEWIREHAAAGRPASGDESLLKALDTARVVVARALIVQEMNIAAGLPNPLDQNQDPAD